jgi:SAM-dependent methyltransferase
MLRAYACERCFVVDPFVGSGTTLIECGRRDHPAFGIDVNPAAIYSARTAELMNISLPSRRAIFDTVYDSLIRHLDHFDGPNLFSELIQLESSEHDTVALIRKSFGQLSCSRPAETIILNTLMQGMGKDGSDVTSQTIVRAFHRYRRVCEHLPYTSRRLNAHEGDARCVPLADEAVDLVITSPPYINVFNYHQNYRKALELVGFKPLKAAPSEIGSNRKHRGNRLLTVIQYCLDMLDVLKEMHRVLRPQGIAIIVVGRESNVRRQRFENGKALYCLAVGGAGFDIVKRHERVFVSRYGPRVFEELLVFTKTTVGVLREAEFARSVAQWLLERAKSQAAADVLPDIEDALAHLPDVMPSPRMKSTYPRAAASVHSRPIGMV